MIVIDQEKEASVRQILSQAGKHSKQFGKDIKNVIKLWRGKLPIGAQRAAAESLARGKKYMAGGAGALGIGAAAMGAKAHSDKKK